MKKFTNKIMKKIRKLNLFSIFILMSITIYAQSPTIEWQRCLGGISDDKAYSIQQTDDGGFIVAGYTYSKNGDVLENNGRYDYWIVKLNNLRVIKWQKCFGGKGSDCAYSIQQTDDGGFIVAGETSSNDGDVSGNHGKIDYWVVKLNSSGDIQWKKCFGGKGIDKAYSIQQTDDGGFIVAGETSSNDGDVSGNHGKIDYWVVKLNSSGDIEWKKCFGGKGSDKAYSIQQTDDGGFIVAGYTGSNDVDVSGYHGYSDYWIVKLISSGDIEWQRCLGGTGNDGAYSIQQTNDGGFIVAGYTMSDDGGDVSGNHKYDKYNYVLKKNYAYVSYDYWVVKLNIWGNIEWQKCLGGKGIDKAYSIQQTDDGGFILAGYSSSNDGDVSGYHGFSDYWIVKLSSPSGIFFTQNLIENKKIFPNTEKDKNDNIEEEIVVGKSDVDIDIPETKIKKPNTFALIIGNEDYQSYQTGLSSEANVDFAINDAKIFKEYAIKTLGIPEWNIIYLTNGKYVEMSRAITKLNLLAKNTQGNCELIFYYAGHGFPDETTKEPYLIPVDASGEDLQYALKLQDVYTKLIEHSPKRVTVILDACFSGGGRNQGLLAARSVKIVPNKNILSGNLVVFSSSSESQSSLPYRDKQHGFFTYFLLKKLQETKGNVTYGELSNYLIKEVGVNSVLISGKEQVPEVNSSYEVKDVWQNWKFTDVP